MNALKVLPVLGAMGLAACQAPLEITAAPAPAQLVAGAPSERIRDTTTQTVVRAYRTGQNEEGEPVRVEVAGAECDLTSDHLRAEVVTPQAVILPKYDQIVALEDRGVPPSVLVDCRESGQRGQSLLAAQPGKVSTGGTGNLAADLFVLAATAAVAASADWRYEPFISVDLQ